MTWVTHCKVGIQKYLKDAYTDREKIDNFSVKLNVSIKQLNWDGDKGR